MVCRKVKEVEFKQMSNVFSNVVTKGGVEHTRLEAKVKAKSTTEIRGQGQPYRGQTLSRPRTGMLEAKDQGHKLKCSPIKKKSSQKLCFRRSPKNKKKVFTKIFQEISKKRSSQKFFRRSSEKKTFSKNFFRRCTNF